MLLKRYAVRLSAASVSPLCEFSLRFVRTIILSRLLMPNDLGAAVALVTILSSSELITDVGLEKFVMVNAGETRAQAVAAAQQITITRAVLLAIAIALFAPVLADIFGASAHVGSIAWLGAVPLIRSFRNLRTVQIQQDYRYGPEAISNVVGQIGAVIVVVPAAAWFRDERAMLASLIVEAALYVMLSHLLVPQERVAAIDPIMRRAALSFGLPLMANGIGLMVLSQLDRVIVANLFDLATLALYSLALNLAIVPISPLLIVVNKIGMPFLGRLHADPTASNQGSLIVVLGVLLCAAAYATVVGLSLDKLVPLLYGIQYKVTPAFCALATIVAFLRICRGAPNLILLTYSRTGRLTAGNMIAGVGPFIGLLLASSTRRVEAALLGLLIGDLASLITLFSLARRHLLMGTVFAHAGLLALPVGLAALGPLIVGGDGLGPRALMLAVGGFVIGLDTLVVYRRVVAGFVNKGRSVSSRQGPDGIAVANADTLERRR